MNGHWRTFTLALLSLSVITGCAAVAVGGATGAAAAHDRRSTGAFIDDEIIEWKAIGVLRNDKELYSQSHINVISYDGVILLSGETPNEGLRTRAADHVRAIDKVRKVHNEIILAAPSAMMSRSSDTVITGQVKTKLFGIKGLEGFDATRVKVVTENGTVYLMGKLRHVEADAVTDTTRQVKGVQRIVRLFEYLD